MFQTYHSKFNFFDCCMCVLLLLNDAVFIMIGISLILHNYVYVQE